MPRTSLPSDIWLLISQYISTTSSIDPIIQLSCVEKSSLEAASYLPVSVDKFILSTEDDYEKRCNEVRNSAHHLPSPSMHHAASEHRLPHSAILSSPYPSIRNQHVLSLLNHRFCLNACWYIPWHHVVYLCIGGAPGIASGLTPKTPERNTAHPSSSPKITVTRSPQASSSPIARKIAPAPLQSVKVYHDIIPTHEFHKVMQLLSSTLKQLCLEDIKFVEPWKSGYRIFREPHEREPANDSIFRPSYDSYPADPEVEWSLVQQSMEESPHKKTLYPALEELRLYQNDTSQLYSAKSSPFHSLLERSTHSLKKLFMEPVFWDDFEFINMLTGSLEELKLHNVHFHDSNVEPFYERDDVPDTDPFSIPAASPSSPYKRSSLIFTQGTHKDDSDEAQLDSTSTFSHPPNSFHNVTTFEWSSREMLDLNLLTHFPNVRILKLEHKRQAVFYSTHSIDYLTQLNKVDLVNVAMPLTASVERAHISLPSLREDYMQALFFKSHQLKHVKFSVTMLGGVASRYRLEPLILTVASLCPLLEDINLSYVQMPLLGFPHNQLERREFPHVRHLRFAWVQDSSFSSLMALLAVLPNLETLIIDGAPISSSFSSLRRRRNNRSGGVPQRTGVGSDILSQMKNAALMNMSAASYDKKEFWQCVTDTIGELKSLSAAHHLVEQEVASGEGNTEENSFTDKQKRLKNSAIRFCKVLLKTFMKGD